MEQDTLLNDAFNLLSEATELEEQYDKGVQKDESLLVKASSTYFEAVFLLKRYLNRLPFEPSSPRSSETSRTRQLLTEKIRHYERVATELLSRLGSSEPSGKDQPQPTHRKSLHVDVSDVPTNCRPSAAPLQSDMITEKLSLANNLLATALDHDENARYDDASASYLSAGELYLEAIKISENSSTQAIDSVTISSIKRKLEGIMDRIEQLKAGPHRKASASPTPSQASAPLSQEEKSVLKRSSIIASGLFLPWSEEEAREMNTSPTAKLWTDPDGLLKLSQKQKARLYKWARPREIITMRGQPKAATIDMIRNIEPYRIKQYMVQDCSFIGSLCICAEYERRLKRRLVTSIIYPQDAKGQPIINPNGKYMVKLWLNGIPRRVVVDDMLPVDRYGNLLCSHTQIKSGLELWVSIVEKAFMKLSGGYDFPGSNSGSDMFALTGWLPERLFFPEDPKDVRDFETPTERAWDRLHSASSYGDCLITTSMSKDVSESEAEKVGLVTGHAYAVLASYRTQNGTRLLRLKNPWAHSGWNGRFSKNDAKSWSDPGLRAEVGYNPSVHLNYDDGVFFIAWEDAIRFFRNIHFSWNPHLFAYRTTLHATWPEEVGADDDSWNIRDNPQYVLTLSEQAVQGATVWVLLSRHVTKQEQEGADVSDFLTIHIHRNDRRKERIRYPSGSSCVYTGAYTNSSFLLVRYDAIGSQDKYLSLVLSQYQKSNDLSYTLSCYCTAPFELGKPTKDPEHLTEIKSRWTPESAGGPPNSPTFGSNPMWAIHIPPGIFGSSQDGSFVQLSCTTEKTIAVNIMLIPVEKLGSRIRRLGNNEPLIDTGDYRHSFVATNLNFVPSGNYTLVVSSYYPGQTGTFSLKLRSTQKIEARPIAS